MRIHVMDILPGDKTLKDVFNEYGLHVLSAQTILDSNSISRLLSHNIDYIEIERSAESSEVQPPPYYASVQASYDHGIAGISLLFDQAIAQAKVEPEIVDDCFQSLANSFHTETSLVSLILGLENNNNYTYHHSVQVGLFSYCITQYMGLPQETAVEFGKAGFLHDIGKCRIDLEIINKPDKLTKEEFEKVKQHALYGKQILEESYPADSPYVIAALQHHERLDGSGYPYGLQEKDIHLVSKIVMVADIYSAMICSRVYQKERDMLFVLKEIYRLSFGQVDPYIAQTFIRNMIPNLVGRAVILSTGERGTIVMTNPSDFFNPLISLDQKFVDLSKHTDLTISKVLI